MNPSEIQKLAVLATEVSVDTIFNRDRTYTDYQRMYFNQNHGLIDSINVQHEEIWKKYDQLVLQDWKATEHDFASCRQEFADLDRNQYDTAMLTLAWQWEADSVAAHSVMPIVSLYNPCEPLFVAYQRIGDNEAIHGLTYARIQKQAFFDSVAAMDRVLKLKESFQRLNKVAEVFARAKYFGHMYQLGLIKETDYQLREALFLFHVALYCLERVQFISSFSITHSMSEAGMLVPITVAVRKIATDEYNIHVPVGRYVLLEMIARDFGAEVMVKSRDKVLAVFKEIYDAEVAWTKFTFSEGRELPGTNARRVIEQVTHCGTDVSALLGFSEAEVGFDFIVKNPHPSFQRWIDINATQTSPQEARPDNYLLGGFSAATQGALKTEGIDDL